MTDILTRTKLDTMGCGNPGCTHDHTQLYLGPKCHEGAPTESSYNKLTGTVTVECSICGKPAAQFAVAKNEEVCPRCGTESILGHICGGRGGEG